MHHPVYPLESHDFFVFVQQRFGVSLEFGVQRLPLKEIALRILSLLLGLNEEVLQLFQFVLVQVAVNDFFDFPVKK